MAGRLSFSIAVNLLTENFKKGATGIKDSLRSMQMQIITFAAALGFAGFGLQGLVSRMIETARATSRAITALKNVSGSTGQFADNLKFINEMSKKYGLEINALTGNYAKFAATANISGMSLDKQRMIFESLSRASTAFGLSADETNGVFLALSQMMSKGKISSEELRLQMGERLPIALQAMAKAAGTSVAGLDKLMKQGKLMSADILPKFAEAINEMIPNVDTDNLETSINRLDNMFTKFSEGAGVKEKYKALIDGMTGILEAGANNMQNIVIGIVAAIVFVITNALTKVYRGYATTGQQIVANANVTHNKLRAAIAARVDAEIALENAKLRHYQATGKQQIAIAREVEKAKQTLSARTTAVNTAHENAKAAAAQAAAIRSKGAWATTYAAISGTLKSLGASLKSMWNMFAPAIIISAIVAIIGHFKNVYDEAQRVKNIFSDYKKEADKITHTSEITQLEKLRSIAYDINKPLKERQTALDALNGILKSNYSIDSKSLTIQGDINDKIEKRIGLLKAQAKAQYYTPKIVEMEDKIGELERKKTELELNKNKKNVKGLGIVKSFIGDEIAGSLGMETVDKVQNEIDQINKVRIDAYKQLEQAILEGGLTNTPVTPSTPETDPDKNAEKKAQKRLEALRKLDEADKQRQIDKLAFDNDVRQSEIDNMDEGFAKQTAQLKLNLDKEYQAIEEHKKKMAKAQFDEAKNQYVSKTGSEKGFEAYYAKADLSKTMPDGLKPADITAQVEQMTAAAKAAFIKGGTAISLEMQKMMSEEMLRFASPLDQQLADINNFYAERLKTAKGNAALTKQLEVNRNKDIEAAQLQHQEKLLQFQSEYSDKEIAISGKKYLFEADKQKVLLENQIQNAKKRVLNLERQQLKDPANETLYWDLKKARQELDGLGTDLEKLPMQKMQEIAGYVSQAFDALGSLFQENGALANESLAQAAETLGGIAQGFAQGGVVGGIMATVGQGINLINKASQAARIHKEALIAIAESIKAQEHAYEMALLLQNLEFESGNGIFGTDGWGKASNAANVYKDAIDKSKKALQELNNVDIVTGHKKTGLFGTGKGKDTYTDLLTLYPELIDAEGKLDVEKAKSILTSRKMSEEDKTRMQNAIDYIETQEQAFAEMKDYLTGIFGDLGNTILDTFVNAFKGGSDAMSNFYSSASDMLANLVKGFINSMRIAPIIKKATDEAMSIMENTNLTDEEKNKKLLDVTGSFIDNVMSGADAVYSDLEYWGNYIKGITGKNPFAADSGSQSSSKGGFETMTQDQAGVLTSRFTGLFDIGVRMEAIMSGISVSNTNIFTQTVSINDELKKQTDILNDQKQIQQKVFFLTEDLVKAAQDIKENTKPLPAIEKNTKGLTTK